MKINYITILFALVFGLCATFTFAQDTVTIRTQEKRTDLYERLPSTIKEKGKLISVTNGSFPPYYIAIDVTDIKGVTADISQALGEILGIKIEHAQVSGLSALLSGIAADRYQLSLGPIGDYPDRQSKNDFVDYVQEFVVFAVQQGNPNQINGLDDTCGKRIAVMAGGSAEQVIRRQSELCVAEGKSAVSVQSFADQPSSILAVRSKRSDAFFSSQAPLIYFVNKTNGQLALSGLGKKNGFDDIFQGVVLPKNSPLTPIILEGIKVLFENGTYTEIMKKWHLENNMLEQPGINLAREVNNE